MKILVIGGTGHMGAFLVPMLLDGGHDVYVGARGNIKPDQGALAGAKFISLNSKDRESIKSLRDYKFDTVVDFPGTAYAVWEELKHDIGHLVACGSLWMYGNPHIVPTPEMTNPPEEAIVENHRKRFADIKKMLEESGKGCAVFTAIMPPNVCGPGKIPLDQYANRSAENHNAMKRGEEVILPDGAEALLGPCDAEDIARLFALAIEKRDAAAGEIFNAGAAYAVTFSEYVNIYADIYGVKIPFKRIPWNEYVEKINPYPWDWWHYYAHMCPDISKARRLLGYEPRYTPEETVKRAVLWMKENGIV